jgi:hypothetical protein
MGRISPLFSPCQTGPGHHTPLLSRALLATKWIAPSRCTGTISREAHIAVSLLVGVWDRGTMHVRDLTVKFTFYAHARRLA